MKDAYHYLNCFVALVNVFSYDWVARLDVAEPSNEVHVLVHNYIKKT